MIMTVPVQEFQLGQRVRDKWGASFTIQSMYLSQNGRIKYSGALIRGFYVADELTLAPERPPYVPSERRTLTRRETDAEMAARHTVERAEYDAQGKGE